MSEEELKNENSVLKSQIFCLKKEVSVYRNILDLMQIKNRRVFHNYLAEDGKYGEGTLHLPTVCLDFEYMFIFQKLFEMHIADLVIDKIHAYRLADQLDDCILSEIFADSKAFALDIFNKQIPQTFLKVRNLKLAVNEFANEEVLNVLQYLKTLQNQKLSHRIDEAYRKMRVMVIKDD